MRFANLLFRCSMLGVLLLGTSCSEGISTSPLPNGNRAFAGSNAFFPSGFDRVDPEDGGGGDMAPIPIDFNFKYLAFTETGMSVTVNDTLLYATRGDTIYAFALYPPAGQSGFIRHLISVSAEIAPQMGYFTYTWWFNGGAEGDGSIYELITSTELTEPTELGIIWLQILYFPYEGEKATKRTFYQSRVFIRERS